MAAGLQIFNEANTLQITNETRPYVLIKSVRITSKDVWIKCNEMKVITSQIFNFASRVREYEDLLFATHTEGWDARCCVDHCGNICMWSDLSIQDGQYIDIYVFARRKPLNRGLSGVQLFNKNEGLIFDSSWYLLNISKVIEIPPDKPSYSGQGFVPYKIMTNCIDSKYAVAMSSRKQIYSRALHNMPNTGSTMGVLMQICCWMNGSTVTLTGVPVILDLTGGWAEYPYKYNTTNTTLLYCIDTTNYPIPYDAEKL